MSSGSNHNQSSTGSSGVGVCDHMDDLPPPPPQNNIDVAAKMHRHAACMYNIIGHVNG